MDLKLQRIFSWFGIAWMVLFFVGFMLVAGLVPPLSPSASATEIAEFLTENALPVRLGLAFVMLMTYVSLPFFVVVCQRIRSLEGKWGTLSLMQVFGGVIFVPGAVFPLMVLAVAAYRPERGPEITQALNDMFWLMFLGLVGALITQGTSTALATFIYDDVPWAFPRWFGYLSIWYVIVNVPAAAVVLFHSGPMAWNGIFAFWLPMAGFFAWLAGLTIVMLRSIKTESSCATTDDAAVLRSTT